MAAIWVKYGVKKFLKDFPTYLSFWEQRRIFDPVMEPLACAASAQGEGINAQRQKFQLLFCRIMNAEINLEQKLRILVVDDDRRMTHTIADILTLSGYEVSQAQSGPEALEMIRAQIFDCVLTDVKMPEMNGVELHRCLREIQPGLPVVLMTAYAADSLIRQGLDEGVVGVFDKPLNINQLLNFFASLARRRVVAIVDDDPAFCQTLKDILDMRGFKSEKITDPHISVEKIAGDAQVVVLDMKLNSITGLDLLKDIRKQYAELPVVLVTGYRQEMSAAIQAALKIDAFACLYKPLEVSRLLEMLASLQVTRLRSLLKTT